VNELLIRAREAWDVLRGRARVGYPEERQRFQPGTTGYGLTHTVWVIRDRGSR
jgi:hypothetical protein